MAFTLVFDGNLKSFAKNPFTTETPFGIPVGAGIGDVMAEAMTLREALQNIGTHEAKEAIRLADQEIIAMLDAHRR